MGKSKNDHWPSSLFPAYRLSFHPPATAGGHRIPQKQVSIPSTRASTAGSAGSHHQPREPGREERRYPEHVASQNRRKLFLGNEILPNNIKHVVRSVEKRWRSSEPACVQLGNAGSALAIRPGENGMRWYESKSDAPNKEVTHSNTQWFHAETLITLEICIWFCIKDGPNPHHNSVLPISNTVPPYDSWENAWYSIM